MTAEQVIGALEWAGGVLLAMQLSAPGPAGYRTNWPSFPQESIPQEPDSTPLRPPRPTSRQVTQMDQIFALLEHIPRDKVLQKRVVQARTLTRPVTGKHIYSWAKLARLLRTDRRAVQRWHAQGIGLIVFALQQKPILAEVVLNGCEIC